MWNTWARRRGVDTAYLSSVTIHWTDDRFGQGPTGHAIRERRPQVVHDIASDERFDPWRTDALRRG